MTPNPEIVERFPNLRRDSATASTFPFATSK